MRFVLATSSTKVLSRKCVLDETAVSFIWAITLPGIKDFVGHVVSLTLYSRLPVARTPVNQWVKTGGFY